VEWRRGGYWVRRDNSWASHLSRNENLMCPRVLWYHNLRNVGLRYLSFDFMWNVSFLDTIKQWLACHFARSIKEIYLVMFSSSPYPKKHTCTCIVQLTFHFQPSVHMTQRRSVFLTMLCSSSKVSIMVSNKGLFPIFPAHSFYDPKLDSQFHAPPATKLFDTMIRALFWPQSFFSPFILAWRLLLLSPLSCTWVMVFLVTYITWTYPHHTRFDPEDGGNMSLQNIGICTEDHTVLQPRRPQPEHLLLWKCICNCTSVLWGTG
jgi:hypothetical protein